MAKAASARRPKRKPKAQPVVPPESAAARAREWVDVVGYGVGKTIRGALPVALAGIGGTELFAPDLLHFVHMSSEWATALLTAACSYYGIPLVRGHGQVPR